MGQAAAIIQGKMKWKAASKKKFDACTCMPIKYIWISGNTFLFQQKKLTISENVSNTLENFSSSTETP